MAHKWSKVTVFCEGWAARQQPQPEPDRASSPFAASPAHPATGDQPPQRCGYPLPAEVFASKNLKRSSHNRYHHLLKRSGTAPTGGVTASCPTAPSCGPHRPATPTPHTRAADTLVAERTNRPPFLAAYLLPSPPQPQSEVNGNCTERYCQEEQSHPRWRGVSQYGKMRSTVVSEYARRVRTAMATGIQKALMHA